MDALTFLAAIQDARNALLAARVQSVQAAGTLGTFRPMVAPLLTRAASLLRPSAMEE
jgi:hypothetical protein